MRKTIHIFLNIKYIQKKVKETEKQRKNSVNIIQIINVSENNMRDFR